MSITLSLIGPMHNLPPGGSISQILCKESGTDWDAIWYSRTFSNAPARAIQTVAGAANGVQLSAFQDAHASYSVTISTTVTLTGNSAGYVVFEVAATNSVTASDWQEISRFTSGQSGTIVVGLTLNQTGGGSLVGLVPAGYFSRLRSVNTATSAGNPTYTFNSGQEVLL